MFTWLWNIRHRKLIKETKAIIRLYLFLRHECGLKEAEKLGIKDLRGLLKRLDVKARRGNIAA